MLSAQAFYDLRDDDGREPHLRCDHRNEELSLARNNVAEDLHDYFPGHCLDHDMLVDKINAISNRFGVAVHQLPLVTYYLLHRIRGEVSSDLIDDYNDNIAELYGLEKITEINISPYNDDDGLIETLIEALEDKAICSHFQWAFTQIRCRGAKAFWQVRQRTMAGMNELRDENVDKMQNILIMLDRKEAEVRNQRR